MPSFGKIGWGLGSWGIALGRREGAQSLSLDDIQAAIFGYLTLDLLAEVQPHHIQSLIATLNSVPPEDITGTLQPVPGVDLPAQTVPVPGVNLGAIGGGHFPENILASLQPVPPFDMSAYIRRGFTGMEDISASLTQSGAIKNIGAFLKPAIRSSKDLEAVLGVIARSTKDLSASVHSYITVDLSATLVTERVFDQTAIIWGYVREVVKDLPAVIRRSDSQIDNFPVAPFKANKHTHTSGRKPNLDKVAKPFFQNKFAFGTVDAGVFVLTLEPVFGTFPDLAASIFAQPFYRSDIGSFIRVAQHVYKDIDANLSSVVSFLNINKVVLDMLPLLNLPGDLIQVGGFLRMRASITPVIHSSTGTSDTAGFVTTATSFKFLIGTTKGLFVPPQVPARVRIETYQNDFVRPDLHATIAGWHELDLGASISDYPFQDITSSIKAYDLSHLAHIAASIAPFKTSDLSAVLNPFGAFEEFLASLTTQGKVDDLPATLTPRINPFSFNVVAVSTKPVSDLGAIINYGNLVRCSPASMVSPLGAYIRSLVTGTDETVQDMPASLNVLRIELDLSGDIIGRKRTRIRTIALTFTAKTRDSERMRGSITPVHPTNFDFSAQISGLSHEFNLSASLIPFRYEPHDVEFTDIERVVNLATGVEKDIYLTFKALVSSYVYEDITNAVYATDRDTWAIDLRTLLRDNSFFDRSGTNNLYVLDSIEEFNTIDEAIRNAIVILTEHRKENIGASIVAAGAVSDLGVDLSIRRLDEMSELRTSLVAVAHSPDISASINYPQSAFSSYMAATASITPQILESITDFSASVVGSVVTDLSAEITIS